MRAVLVSRNEDKVRELRAILAGWEIEPIGALELPEETGATFHENARAKARFGRSAVDPEAWVLGEDSGLEVEALDGRPGIYSARYGGLGATNEANVAKLLRELETVAETARAARYVCELVALSPRGDETRARGTLTGRIAGEPRGTGGFGYDPVFVPEGSRQTVAELGAEWKVEHSHRARAAHSLAEALRTARPPL